MSVFFPPIPKICWPPNRTNAVCLPPVRPPVSTHVFPLSWLAHNNECPPTASDGTYIVPSGPRNDELIGWLLYPPTWPVGFINLNMSHVAPLLFDEDHRKGTFGSS